MDFGASGCDLHDCRRQRPDERDLLVVLLTKRPCLFKGNVSHRLCQLAETHAVHNPERDRFCIAPFDAGQIGDDLMEVDVVALVLADDLHHLLVVLGLRHQRGVVHEPPWLLGRVIKTPPSAPVLRDEQTADQFLDLRMP